MRDVAIPAFRIFTSSYPSHILKIISVSQLLRQHAPDDVEEHKLICEDDWSGKRITYAEIREDSARGAYGLRNVIGLQGLFVCMCAERATDILLEASFPLISKRFL